MSESKKAKRVLVPVSRTNFNRVKYKTHSLVNVLNREGYRGHDGSVLIDEKIVDLRAVDLIIRPKQEIIPPRKEAPKANDAATP